MRRDPRNPRPVNEREISAPNRISSLQTTATEGSAMAVHPLAGKPAPPEALIDVAKLEREFLSRKPDPANPRERVKFGTSGHRGTPLDGSLTAAHILAITQAICDYRSANKIDGPLYMGQDTH